MVSAVSPRCLRRALGDSVLRDFFLQPPEWASSRPVSRKSPRSSSKPVDLICTPGSPSDASWLFRSVGSRGCHESPRRRLQPTSLFRTWRSSFPVVEVSAARALVLTLLIGFLAIVNYRGVSQGARVSNLFTVTKLLVLGFFICGGVFALLFRPEIRINQPTVPIDAADWFEAILLMTYAYGGFEAALFVAGETDDARKDAPVALLVALITSTILFVSVQYVVVNTLPNAASSTRPAADAAGRFWGPTGASLIAIGTLIALYGYLSANMLHTPRLTFAMGERADFPAAFAAVHSRFRTPSVSIVTFAVMLVIFATIGSYRWNVTLTAVSRLLIYGSIVAALPVLRRTSATVDAFRLPHATVIVTLALAFTGALVTRMDSRGFGVVVGTIALAGLNWAWARTRPTTDLP